MDILLTQVPQLILCLALLIVLHEMGHFFPARWFKVRVEKFYLFFDPWFSLWKKKKGDTEYGIGWLPLGGYVKLSGMVDESMDKAQMAKPPEPWEFRSKPAWQRLIIMIGGVVVNLLLGLFIYSMVMFAWGRETLPFANMTNGIHPSELMAEYGFKDGDIIVRGEGAEGHTIDKLNRALLLGDCRTIVVLRDGKEVSITLPDEVDQGMLKKAKEEPFMPRFPLFIDSVLADMNASRTDLKKGDRVVAVNGAATPFFNDFQARLKSHQNQVAALTVLRGTDTREIAVLVDSIGRIGVMPRDPKKLLNIVKEEFSFFAAFPAGIETGIDVLTGQARSMKLLATKEGAKQVGGFWSILNLFGEWGNWERFWRVTALISIILAFMNILPIPALDGGHVMFLLYEIVARKPAPQRVMEVAQMVGMVLLLGLLLYANGNDVFKGLTGQM
jgi:regulator of sigma E protease